MENIDLGITLIDADHRILMTNAPRDGCSAGPLGTSSASIATRSSKNAWVSAPIARESQPCTPAVPPRRNPAAVLDDGRRIQVRIQAFPVLEDGKPTRFIEVIENITERKRFQDQLEETRRQLQALMDNLPGMAYRCRNDADRTMEFVSLGSLNLTGHSAEELVRIPQLCRPDPSGGS